MRKDILAAGRGGIHRRGGIETDHMGEDIMTIYITQGRYTDQAIQGFVAKPEDRATAVRKLMKAAGARMISYYVTLGEYDFLVISEGKDLTGMMGGLIAAAAGGGVTGLKTTVAMTTADAMKAMAGAKKIGKGFRSAGK